MKRALILAASAFALISTSAKAELADWRSHASLQIEPLGHRNVIIVADSAYPIQTGTGIKVLSTGADHLEVVKYVSLLIQKSKAVRALIALDKQFAFVPEKHATGAAALRKEILAALDGKSAAPIREELHERLLEEVNTAAKDFQVVVLKTAGTVAYSSVFFTLDCGYWSAEAEADLRKAMENQAIAPGRGG